MATHPQLISEPGSAQKQYKYFGLGLPVRDEEYREEAHYPNGAYPDYRAESELIYVREVAMMDVMGKLTDKPDWHKKIFDDAIVEKWRTEALAIPDDDFYKLVEGGSLKPVGVLNDGAFDWCIKELRDKAKYFEETAIVPTLDACFSVAKSDSIVPQNLHQALCSAFDQVKTEQVPAPDWHPNSNDMVQDLVHPSMYPLVYGRTRVFREECVGVEDAVKKWAGTGTILPKDVDESTDNMWSQTYQWLPANVAFQQDGSVKLTSYINNLHPVKHKNVYATIERLIEKSLPLWDQCLTLINDHDQEEGTGIMGTRMNHKDDCDDEEPSNWIPSDPAECADAEVSAWDLEEAGWDEGYTAPEELAECKWRAVRQPRIPDVPDFQSVSYAPKEGTRLIERYASSGLQVIVKMASIELTPEKPEFPAGGWHVEGQMNEWICGTALHYLDSENITASNLSFRLPTDDRISEYDAFQVGQEQYKWLEAVYGTYLSSGSPSLQNYGNVNTQQGRLLAFPNVFQHCVSSFKLIDPTKPGHRRFIALWLVDPTKRIISTANVPPQQMSWYLESLLGDAPKDRKEALNKLPPELVKLLQEKGVTARIPGADDMPAENAKLPEELMDMVRKHFDADGEGMPMGVEEAREHRLALMRERGAFRETTRREWQRHSYSFCEH